MAPSTIICNGSYYVIMPSGTLTYTYSVGKNFGPIYTYTPGVGTNTATGNVNFPYTSYSVTGTDAKGYVSTIPAVVNVTVAGVSYLDLPSNQSATGACVNATYTVNSTNLVTKNTFIVAIVLPHNN